ncbi:MAG TPA: glycoside hydrolase family 3 C-terminal domain-containing protein, partial [Chitinophagaceae bacterium]|nr:glycoside hydrolase family 3 C-terminal domain-containing protein [Chitinophagaceae bacterium]
NPEREQKQLNNPVHRAAARDMAKKSIVLLKNQEQLLPLSKETKSIALIGPFIKAVRDNLGFWSMEWPDDSSTIVTQWQGIKDRVSGLTKLLYAKGCNINDSSKAGFAEAIEAAMQAEVVIMSMG